MEDVLPPAVWIDLGKYGATLVAAGVVGFFGLKYGLKETREKLLDHIADDQQTNIHISETLSKTQTGIETIINRLGEHNTALALHDDRTIRTAETMAKIAVKLDGMSEKIADLRINQERIAGRLDTDMIS